MPSYYVEPKYKPASAQRECSEGPGEQGTGEGTHNPALDGLPPSDACPSHSDVLPLS